MWTHPATGRQRRPAARRSATRSSSPRAGRSRPARPGVGRLAELAAIVDAVVAAVGDRPVRAPDPAARPPLDRSGPRRRPAGRHIVVTAGGTREAIDPVRFIGNRSTGRMGVAIAEAALDRGARVTVIAANAEVPLPPTADVVRVESTADLRAALLRADARADGRRRVRRPGHGRRGRRLPARGAGRDQASREATHLTLQLEATPDLLAEVARIARGLDSDGATDTRARSTRARSSSASRPRPARSIAPTRSCAARASTSSSPTTSPSPAPASAPRPTASRSSRPTARATTCRSSPSARSPTRCSTGSPPRWTSATRPPTLERRTEPEREPA